MERWPEFFAETCVYKVIPRENVESAIPVALIYCESRVMLMDRVVALRDTALFAPRSRAGSPAASMCAQQGGRAAPDSELRGVPDDADELSALFLCGEPRQDMWSRIAGAMRFAERLCIYASLTIVSTSLVFRSDAHQVIAEFLTGLPADPPWMKPDLTVMARLVPAIRSGRVPDRPGRARPRRESGAESAPDLPCSRA